MNRPPHLDEFNAGVLRGLELAATWLNDYRATDAPAYNAIVRGIRSLSCPDCDPNGLIHPDATFRARPCGHPNLTTLWQEI